MNCTYRILIILAMPCFCLILPQSVSRAATYYISPYQRGASDSNPGTEVRPFKTIGKATELLRPGDTLLIRAGLYRETVILSQSGTETNPIKIMACPGDEGKVIINAAEPVANWQKCAGPQHANLTNHR